MDNQDTDLTKVLHEPDAEDYTRWQQHGQGTGRDSSPRDGGIVCVKSLPDIESSP